MTVNVKTQQSWTLQGLAMRATMAVLNRFDVRFITIYVDRRNKPAWTAQIGWL